MISLHELKAGDTVLVSYEGQLQEGKVMELNPEDKQVCVLTGEENEFWYGLESLFPILLDETQLLKLKFKKDEELSRNGDGQVFVRGPFSVRIRSDNGQKLIDLHYRDETRALKGDITVNELQNHYIGMTNFHLE